MTAQNTPAEPVAHLHVGGIYGDELQDWDLVAEQGLCDLLNEQHFASGKEAKIPLYASPQPAAQQPDVPPELDVRRIMLDVVPGPDGIGKEVFAASVDDVVRLLGQMSDRLDLLAAQQPVAVPVGWKLAALPVEWTPGGDWFKDWCANWFGPDADDDHLRKAIQALLAAAPQAPSREPLSDEQIKEICNAAAAGYVMQMNDSAEIAMARAIERAHGITNDGSKPHPQKRPTADDMREPKNGKDWRVEWWNESLRMMLPTDMRLDGVNKFMNGTLVLTLKKRASTNGITKEGGKA